MSRGEITPPWDALLPGSLQDQLEQMHHVGVIDPGPTFAKSGWCRTLS